VTVDRVVIIGFGSMGQRYLRLIRQILPKVQIGILASRSNRTIQAPSVCVLSNMAEVKCFLPDIGIICNPAPFHLDFARQLAELNVHLLIEKPLSVDLKGVENLIQICNKSNLKLALGYNLRFLPSLKKFKSFIDENLIGSILSVRCEVGQYLPEWRKNTKYQHSVSAQKKLGGGVLLELSHELDYLIWIFGKVEWVQATLTTQSDLEIDVEDVALINLGFCSKGHSKSVVANVCLDFFRRDSTRTCIAIGNQGSLKWNGLSGKVEVLFSNECKWQEVFSCQEGGDQTYSDEIKNLLNSIENGTNPLIGIFDGINVLHVIEAIRASDSLKKVISVDELNSGFL